MTDLALMQRWIRNRDPAAFSRIVDRYAAMVFATCWRILGNPTEAEDVTQECFEILASAEKGPSENLGAWLHGVATHRALNHIRSENRRRDREIKYVSTRGVCREIMWDDVYPHVDEAIAALPESIRIPLVAHYLEREPRRQIAKRLGVSCRTISYRIQRGVELVGESLKRKGITLSTTALAGFLGSQLATAAPITTALAASLGKLALAHAGGGVPSSASASLVTLGGFLVMKKAVVVLAMLTICSVGWLLLSGNETMREQDRIPTVAPEDLGPEFETVAVVAESSRAPQLDTSTEDRVERSVIAKGSISGYAVDTRGRWLPNSTVTAYLPKEGEKRIWKTQTRSDASGRFSLTGLDPGTYEFYVEPEGVVLGHVSRQAIRVPLREREHRRGIRLIWQEGLAVWGRVTDIANRPIEGVRVFLGFSNSVELLTETRKDFDAMTDDTGTFHLGGFPDEPGATLTMNALHDRYVTAVRTDVRVGSEQNFVLHKKNVFAGRVVDAVSGQPVTNFTVLACPFDEEYFDTNMDYWEQNGLGRASQEVQDPAGRFRIQNEVYGQDMVVVAEAAGFALGYELLQGVGSGEELRDVVVKLHRQAAGEVYGIVVDSSGSPIPGAWITQGYTDAVVLDATAKSESDGTFHLSSVPARVERISAWHPSYEYAPGWTQVTMGGSSEEAPYRITLSHGGSILGSVTVDGVPLNAREAHVRLEFPDGREHQVRPNTDWTDAEGRFAIRPVAPGNISAHVSLASENRWLIRRLHVIEGQTTETSFDFVMQDYDAALEGSIVVGETAPAAASVRVVAILADGGEALFATQADNTGHYRLDYLPAGTLDCEMRAQAGSGAWLPIRAYTLEMQSGATLTLDVDMLE